MSRKRSARMKSAVVSAVSVDLDEIQGYVGDGVFEVGSRHPKWRGGTSKALLRRRQQAYHKYGVGVVTASNSRAAQATADTRWDPIADVIAGRRKTLKIKNISSLHDCTTIANMFFGETEKVALLPDPDEGGYSRFIQVGRVTYTFWLSRAEGEKSYVMELHYSINNRVRQNKSLLQIVREHRRKKQHQEEARRKLDREKKRERRHVNPIRGLDTIK